MSYFSRFGLYIQMQCNLQSKLMNWFLYHKDHHHERFKMITAWISGFHTFVETMVSGFGSRVDSLHKKWSSPLRISSVNVTKSSNWIFSFFEQWYIHGRNLGLPPMIYSVNLRNHCECRKIRIRNNSVFGHFSRSGFTGKLEKDRTTLAHLYRFHPLVNIMIFIWNYTSDMSISTF